MMRDRTGVRWLALAALLAVVATACGGTEESGSAPPQTPPEVGFPPWATAPVVRATRPAVDKIAFVSAGDIWVVNPDGTGRKRLTEGKSTDEGELSWSPDGTRIAFVGREWGIHMMNADGTDVVQLTDPVAAGEGPSWSADGVRGLDRSPSWSPDGTRIAFVRDLYPVTGGEVQEVPHVMNVDGSGLRVLSLEDGFAMTGDLSWAPDGTEVVFFAFTVPTDPPPPQFAYEEGLYAVDVQTEGTEMRAINTGFWGARRQWSPDGTEVIFIHPSGQEPGLYAMDVNSGETRLLHPLFGHEPEKLKAGRQKWVEWSDLAISPDGGKIAIQAGFVVDQCDGPECDTVGANTEIFVINADGSDLTRLTRHRASDHSPSWSPDGTRIAFVSDRHGRSIEQIFVMNADGSGVTQLTFDRWGGWPPAHSPKWSPPSRP